MRSTIQYIVDNKGMKTSVIIPFKKRTKLNEEYHKLQNKLKIFHSIKEGLSEIQASKKQGKKLQTLSDFLDENHC